jgi:RimJ/RimL family protein N-acetyltransferase
MSDINFEDKINLCYITYSKNDIEQETFLRECECNVDCEEERIIASFSYKVQDLIFCDKQSYLVMDLDLGKYVGICIMEKVPYDNKTLPTPISICYAVIKPYRKRGYATTILKEMINELFSNRDCIKIVLEIEPTNSNSLKVASKFDFKKDAEYSKIFEKEDYKYLALSLNKGDYQKIKTR